MAVIRPFDALRPPPERAKAVASVPYDVVNTEEARALAAGNPLSFLHVSRPEIDLPDGTDLYSDIVYRQAAANFERLIKTCPLEREVTPSLYLYRLIMGDHQQVGIVACCSVDEYDKNIVRKHERTRRDKEDDRTHHMLMLRAQTGPVFLTYRRSPAVDDLVSEAIASEPLYDFSADDGIQHTIWRVKDPQPLVTSFGDVPLLYIADGHHRAASASRARAELKEQSFVHTGQEEYNFFLAVIFPDSQLQILPYNRVVRDLNGLSQTEFLAAIKKEFEVSENASPAPSQRGRWSMYLGGRWYGLKRSSDTPATQAGGTVTTLDVSILQDRLLDPILGIKDVRTDKRIDFVGGLRGLGELEKRVNSGEMKVAFALFPVTMKQLINIADSGKIFTRKGFSCIHATTDS